MNPNQSSNFQSKPTQYDTDTAEASRLKKEIQQKYNMLAKDLKEQAPSGYRYILLRGNNDKLVARVMDTRASWTKIDSIKSSLFNFKWSPVSSQIRFDFLGKHGEKNLVNHFEFHGCLTQKDQLYLHLQKACDNSNRDVFDLMPTTFVLDYADKHVFQTIFDRFTIYFNTIEKWKKDGIAAVNQAVESHPNLKSKSSYAKSSLALRDSMLSGSNLWVLKPNDCNRGRGVQLFSSLDTLKKLILDYTQGVEVQPSKAEPEEGAEDEDPKPKKPLSIIKSDVFVIQKYIEKPLLVNERKFDIRCWVLITQEHKCYLFREGYIRTSSYKYTLTDVKTEIHLTNIAIQKKDKNFGAHEDGNILSYQEASVSCVANLQDACGFDFYQLAREEILPIIETSLVSARLKLNKNSRRYCFELFGYDFMVDE